MVWGKYPTSPQKEELRQVLATTMSKVPESVVNTIKAFP